MKRVLTGLLFLFAIVAIALNIRPVLAQGMMGNFGGSIFPPSSSGSSTAQDEQAGSLIWRQFQNKQVTCGQLTEDDFDKLGDFLMGQMAGANHERMDQMMTQRLGDAGEKQMHVAMAQRLTGCNTNATLPQGGSWFPMMAMMGGYWGNFGDGVYSSMMGGWGSLSSPTGTLMFLLGLVGLFDLILIGIFFWRKISILR